MCNGEICDLPAHKDIHSYNTRNNKITVMVKSSSWLSKNLKIKIYRTIILPVVLYGCETWSLTLLRVFEENIWA